MSDKPDYKLIRASSMGKELSDEECQILADIMGVIHSHDGETLVSKGDVDNTLFLLIKGKLTVSGMPPGQELMIYGMNVGECAGTRAFIDGTPRKATLCAVGDTTLYTLKPDAFEALLDPHPRIVYKVMRALFRITHSNLMRMNQESQELVNYVSKTRGRY